MLENQIIIKKQNTRINLKTFKKYKTDFLILDFDAYSLYLYELMQYNLGKKLQYLIFF